MPTLPGATSAREHRPGPGFVPEDVLRRTRKQPSSRRVSSSRTCARSLLYNSDVWLTLYQILRKLINPNTYRNIEKKKVERKNVALHVFRKINYRRGVLPFESSRSRAIPDSEAFTLFPTS